MADPYQNFLSMIERQQGEVTGLSAKYEALTKQAYAQARDDISSRMSDLIESRGGLGGLSARDRYRLTRDAGLIDNIDGRLSQLGAEHTGIVTQAFQESGSLAVGHLGDEMAALVAHANSVSGIATPVGAAVNFARLDTAAIELGLGTALNDVTALNQATKVALRREITAGVAAGEGIRDLTKRVALLDGLSETRGEVITRWATIKSYNLQHQATYEAAEQQITGLMKEWVTQNDERACPHCMAHYGEVVGVTDEFDGNLTYANTPPDIYQGFLEVPPLHARCRCTIASWHESWRAYTERTPEELQSEGRDTAIQRGFPKASTAGVTGVAPTVGIQKAASNALGDLMKGVYVFDDFSGTVRMVDGADLNQARLALRDAGFRVTSVADDPRLMKIEWPQGLKLPRTIRSTKFKALSASRWDEIKKGLLSCGIK